MADPEKAGSKAPEKTTESAPAPTPTPANLPPPPAPHHERNKPENQTPSSIALPQPLPTGKKTADHDVIMASSVQHSLGAELDGADDENPILQDPIKFPPPLTWDQLGDLLNPPPPEVAADHRWYVGLLNTQKSYGVAAKLSRYRPKVEYGAMSLIQTAMANREEGHPVQTIEAGWQRYGYKDSPKFFIFYTTTGYDQPPPGPDKGLGFGGYANYNADKVEDLGDWYRLKKLDPLPCCHIDGSPLTIDIKWQLLKNLPFGNPDGWYLAVNGEWIGCYRLELFNRKPPNVVTPGPDLGKEWPMPDQSTTLGDHASEIQLYGEIYDPDFDRKSHDPTKMIPTSTDMGSGKFPEEGWRKSAFISNIMRLPNTPDVSTAWEEANDNWTEKTGEVIDNTLYRLQYQPLSPTDLRSFCYLGGPGGPLKSSTWSDWDAVTNVREFLLMSDSRISIIERTTDRLDIFVAAADGKVYTCFWQDDDWSGFNSLAEWEVLDWGPDHTPVFNGGTYITACSRSVNNMDLFAVANDGKVYNAWWVQGNGWSGWRQISGDQTFTVGTPIAAVGRTPTNLDIFINNNGTILHGSWTQAVQGKDWPAPWTTIGSGFPLNSEILALSRGALLMDVFVMGTDGLVYTNSWLSIDVFSQAFGVWIGFGNIGTMPSDGSDNPPVFTSGTKIAGVAKGSDSTDLFVIGSDFQLYTTHWQLGTGWAGTPNGPVAWSSLGFGYGKDAIGSDEYAFDPLKSDIVAITRMGTFNTGSIDVFITGIDGYIWRTSWNETSQVWSTNPTTGGWDNGIGGTLKPWSRGDSGFTIAVASRAGFALTVLTVDRNGVINVSEYQGV